MSIPSGEQLQTKKPGLVMSHTSQGGSTAPAQADVPGRHYRGISVSHGARAHFGDAIFHDGTHNHYHDHHDVAAQKQRTPVITIKWLKDPSFVGREDTLHEIERILIKDGRLALTGQGGVGKSQVAIEFCRRWESSHPNFHILWIHASSLESFHRDYRALARKFKLKNVDHNAEIHLVRDLVKDFLAAETDWIMVVDNADTYDNFFESEDRTFEDTITEALPTPTPGVRMILYTSRYTRLANDLAQSHTTVLPLDVLDHPDSIEMLRRKLPEKINVSDPQAYELVEALDRLPLSIAHAAGYLRLADTSVDDYVKGLNNDDDRLNLLDERIHISGSDSTAPRSVVRTLLKTHDLLMQIDVHAAHLFFFMACLDRQSISKEILRAVVEAVAGDDTLHGDNLAPMKIVLPVTQPKLDLALGELLSLNLIYRSSDQGHFGIHRLVQEITIHRLKGSQQHHAFFEFTAQRLADNFLVTTYSLCPEIEDWKMAQQLAPSIERLEYLLQQSRLRIGGVLLEKLGIYFLLHGQNEKALTCFSECAERCESDVDHFICLMWTIMSWAASGATSKALALATSRSEPLEGVSLSDFAEMCDLFQKSSFGQLEKLCRELIMQSTVTAEIGRVYLALALSHGGPDSLSEAKALLRSIETELDGAELMNGPDAQSHLIYSLIGSGYMVMDDYAQADRFYDRAIAGAKEIFGECGYFTIMHRVMRVSSTMHRCNSEFSEITSEQLNELINEAKVLNHTVVNQEVPASTLVMYDVTHIVANSMYMKVKKSTMTSTDRTHINRELAADIDETERLLMSTLNLSGSLYGALSPTFVQEVLSTHEFLRVLRSVARCNAFARQQARLMAKKMSEGGSFAEHGLAMAILEPLLLVFMRDSSLHSICLQMLCECVRQYQRVRTPKEIIEANNSIFENWLERMQTRHLLVRAMRESRKTPNPVFHTAECANCSMPIRGICHKCPCNEYDTCTDCVMEVGSQAPSCQRDGPVKVPVRHRVFPVYDETYHYPGFASEMSDDPALHDFLLFSGEDIPLRQRWHHEVSQQRDPIGYESEPDEARRTRTRLKNHYARQGVEGVGNKTSRKRSQSLGPESVQTWQDLVLYIIQETGTEQVEIQCLCAISLEED